MNIVSRVCCCVTTIPQGSDGWEPCVSDVEGAGILDALSQAGHSLPADGPGPAAARAEAAALGVLMDASSDWYRSPTVRAGRGLVAALCAQRVNVRRAAPDVS